MPITGEVIVTDESELFVVVQHSVDGVHETWTFIHLHETEVVLVAYEQRESANDDEPRRFYVTDESGNWDDAILLELADVPLPDDVVLELSRLRQRRAMTG